MREKQSFVDAGYSYVRYDKATGLHILRDDGGKLEYFRASRAPHSGWGLYSKSRRLYYEFIRSA